MIKLAQVDIVDMNCLINWVTKVSRIEPTPGEGGDALADPTAIVETTELSVGGTEALGDAESPEVRWRMAVTAGATLISKSLTAEVTSKPWLTGDVTPSAAEAPSGAVEVATSSRTSAASVAGVGDGGSSMIGSRG
jgi:hypothetical protein